MRLLIVGSVPPPGGAGALRLGAFAASRRAVGDSVEILSPDRRSAAHHHARLDGWRLALQLGLRARHFDAVHLALGPDLPLREGADRLTRALTLFALGEALRGYAEVTVELPSPIPLPGGVGGRPTTGLWSRVTRVVVENDDDREQMLAVPGIDPAAVVLFDHVAPDRRPATPEWTSIPPDAPDLRARLQVLVRERAAHDRAVNAARLSLGASTTIVASGGPFDGAAGTESAPSVATLARLGAGKARRLVSRGVRRRR